MPPTQRRTIWFEPVSAAKAVRGLGILSCLDFMSPNVDELTAIAAQLCPDRPLAADAPVLPSAGLGTATARSTGTAEAAVTDVRWALAAVLQVCSASQLLASFLVLAQARLNSVVCRWA